VCKVGDFRSSGVRALKGRGVAPCSRVMPLRGVSASQGSTLSPGGQEGPERTVTTQHRATPRPICTKKLAGYTAAGFPVYWILDLGLRQLEVYRDPGPSGYSTEEVIA